jgi:predicted ATP-dependent Lon-type protease
LLTIIAFIDELTTKLDWKLVVYGSPYVVKKIAFIDELHTVLAGWQGPACLEEILTSVDSLQTKAMVGLIKKFRLV